MSKVGNPKMKCLEDALQLKHVKIMELRQFGSTKINHPFNKETGLTGLHWVTGFSK